MRYAFALVAAAALALASALPGSAVTARSTATAPPGPRIALVTDGGALTDPGFTSYVWAGVQQGARSAHGSAQGMVPPRNAEGYAWAIGWFADQGYDVVVTSGFLLIDATIAAARAYPRIQFIGVDQSVAASAAPANYERLVFDEAEAGYLAGFVAARVSVTHTVGAVGGTAIPPVEAYIRGYRAGVAAGDPTTRVLVSYAGAFDRPDLGAAAASGEVTGGADVLFGVAGSSNLGVFSTACGGKRWAIGVDVDQWVSVPAFSGCIVTSAEKRLTRATSLAIERYTKKGVHGGEFVNDASNGGIGLSRIRNVTAPAGLDAALRAALAGLADGSIKP